MQQFAAVGPVVTAVVCAWPPLLCRGQQIKSMSNQSKPVDEWEEREKLRDYCVKGSFYQAMEWGSVFGVAGSAAVVAANKYSPAFRRCVASRVQWPNVAISAVVFQCLGGRS